MEYPKLHELYTDCMKKIDADNMDFRAVRESFSHMILSSSGWRKIFASNGDEESMGTDIRSADAWIAIAAASVFLNELPGILEQTGTFTSGDSRTILLASDSRHTGPSIAFYAAAAALGTGWNVRFLGIAPVPEVTAYAALDADIHGFIYISASHNPPGHNGIKFGTRDGVIGGSHAAQLIRVMQDTMQNAGRISAFYQSIKSVDQEKFRQLEEERVRFKMLSEDAYRQFTGMTASSSLCICSQDAVYSIVRNYAEEHGLGVVIDFNGSARAASIDTELLSSLGIKVRTLNDAPGAIAHRIVPEGDSLEPCRKALEEAFAEDPAFVLGYVPDCDGDRGNIVYIDEYTGRASILGAQDLFALTVMSELAFLRREEAAGGPSPGAAAAAQHRDAVAVNGPTSMRIDEIAACFQAEVFRAEVGEANVVTLAKQLRDSGWRVRILGEGSNGGNITHPSVVRDPLNTIFSLLKLLAVRDEKGIPGILHMWFSAMNKDDDYDDHFLFSDILSTLPVYTTTSAYEDRAIMRITSENHAFLKKRYEQLFAEAWERHAGGFFSRMGLKSWEEFNYEGTESRKGTGPSYRSGSEKGGLKIVFYDTDGIPSAFIWMRGSGTEPVFRVLTDCRGSRLQMENDLLEWHKELIREADALACRNGR